MNEVSTPEARRPLSLDGASAWRDLVPELVLNNTDGLLRQSAHGELNEATSNSGLSEAERGSSCHDRGDGAHLSSAQAHSPVDTHPTQSRDEALLTAIGSGVGIPLKDELRNATRRPRNSDEEFIPIDEFDRIITRQSVQRELQSFLSGKDLDICLNQVWDIHEYVDSATGQRTFTTRRKIFAILVLLQKLERIRSFIDENLWDKDLPFVSNDDNIWECQAIGHRGKARTVKCLNDLNTWNYLDADSFCHYQWRMLSPIFSMVDGKVEFYHLHRCIVLPFEEESDHDEECSLAGGFGDVSRVLIHPAHYNLDGPTKNQAFAIKKLRSKDKMQFNSEVESLKRFSRENHPHLIKLLATYRHGKHYNLIFPWADGNLKDFWKRHASPIKTYELAFWIAGQCKGIANGLKMIHSGEFNETSLNPSDTKKGRHGDIKPENILWFKDSVEENKPGTGVLKISDFGLTRWHRDISNGKKYSKGLAFSPTYRAPETYLNNPVSQPWDIWTLGCLFLDFLTWYLYGWENGVDEFSKKRASESFSFCFSEDNYFNLSGSKTGSGYGASLKPCVVEWINKLHRTEGCSQFVHEFLDIISNDMLRIRYTERNGCKEIVYKLDDLYHKCENSEAYCFKSAHTSVRKRRTNDSDEHNPFDASIIHDSEDVPSAETMTSNDSKGRKSEDYGGIVCDETDTSILGGLYNQEKRYENPNHSNRLIIDEGFSPGFESSALQSPPSIMLAPSIPATVAGKEQGGLEGRKTQPSARSSVNVGSVSSTTMVERNGYESPRGVIQQDGNSLLLETSRHDASSYNTEIEENPRTRRPSLPNSKVARNDVGNNLNTTKRRTKRKRKRLYRALKRLMCCGWSEL